MSLLHRFPLFLFFRIHPECLHLCAGSSSSITHQCEQDLETKLYCLLFSWVVDMIKALESSGHDKSPLSALREATIDFLYDTGKENLFSYLKVDNFFQGIPATFSRQDGQCVRNKFSCFLLVPFARIISSWMPFNFYMFRRCWLIFLLYPCYLILQWSGS